MQHRSQITASGERQRVDKFTRELIAMVADLKYGGAQLTWSQLAHAMGTDGASLSSAVHRLRSGQRGGRLDRARQDETAIRAAITLGFTTDADLAQATGLSKPRVLKVLRRAGLDLITRWRLAVAAQIHAHPGVTRRQIEDALIRRRAWRQASLRRSMVHTCPSCAAGQHRRRRSPNAAGARVWTCATCAHQWSIAPCGGGQEAA